MADASEGPHLPTVDGFRDEKPQPAAPPVQPAPPPVVAPPVDLSNMDVLCRRCQFNLRGLTPERNCPECGFPIQRTLAGDPLVLSSPKYLQTLSSGLKWIIIATIVQYCMSFLGGIVGAVVGFATEGNANQVQIIYRVELIAVLVTVPVSFALLYGWWRFSTPDPEIVVGDSGDAPRRIVRGATALLAVTTVLSSIATFFHTNPMMISPFMIGVGSLAVIVGIAQFFASLLYARWIALRLHDAKLAEKSTRYLWMLPLIYIVGFCVIVGPLIAVVLYLLMLNDVRRGINFARAQQAMQNTGPQPA